MSRIKWKSVRGMKWTPESFADALGYLRSDKFPASVGDDKAKRYRYRKQMSPFALKRGETADKDEIVLQITDKRDVWYAHDPKTEKQLFEVKLPMVLRVLNPTPGSARDAEGNSLPKPEGNLSDKEWVMLSMFRDLSGDAYRSVEQLHFKLSQHYVGATREDVKRFLATVDVKQMQDPSKLQILKPIIADRPGALYQADLQDMQALAKSNQGVNYLLYVMDVHSKYMWCRPLKNKTADLVASELQNIFLEFGSCDALQTDNGSEFVNEQVSIVCDRFGIRLLHPRPYQPAANGAIERNHSSHAHALFTYMADHATKVYLPILKFVTYAHNTARHRTTKMTPFSAYFYRDVSDSIVANAQKRVKQNTVSAAIRMMEADLRKQGAALDPLVPSDVVRIATSALPSGRKRRLTKLAKNRGKIQWSRDLYIVAQVKTHKGVNDKDYQTYSLLDRETGELQEENGRTRWYGRHELQKVDLSATDKTSAGRRRKPDLNFGQEYDVEAHLADLSERAREAASLDEDEVKEEEEKQERIDAARVAAARRAEDIKLGLEFDNDELDDKHVDAPVEDEDEVRQRTEDEFRERKAEEKAAAEGKRVARPLRGARAPVARFKRLIGLYTDER